MKSYNKNLYQLTLNKTYLHIYINYWTPALFENMYHLHVKIDEFHDGRTTNQITAITTKFNEDYVYVAAVPILKETKKIDDEQVEEETQQRPN